MRPRLSKGSGTITFFSFQDIVTAVTGIMVLIALMMSLQVVQPSGQSQASPNPELQAELDRLRQDKEVLDAKVQAVLASAKTNAVGDASSIEAQIDNIAATVAKLKQESSRLVMEQEGMNDAGLPDSDVAALRAANKEARERLEQMQRDTEKAKRESESYAERVSAVQQGVLEAARSSGDIWLIPQRDNSSKEPVVVSVLGDALVAQSMDSREEVRVPRTADVRGDLQKLLAGKRPVDNFVVFYFRPSTLASFEQVVAGGKALSYEVGYDVAEEGSTIRFGAPDVDPGPKATPAPTPSAAPDATQGGGEKNTATASDKIDIQDVIKRRGEPEGSGSGFFISSDGYFVTNHHVVEKGAAFYLGSPELGWREARVVASSKDADLALLKADVASSSMPVRDSDGVALGQTVATIGFPNIQLQGIYPKLSKGEIASLAGVQDEERDFQISVAVQPGNSGGVLFDEKGFAVGVVCAKLSQEAAYEVSGTLPENVNYAVKSKVLLGWLDSLNVGDLKVSREGGDCDSFEKAVQRAQKAAALVLIFE